MERLKAILADKILDLSAGNGEDVKAKIDKIQRFRDFANACKTLMNKYPSIEDELINMVEDGDFDTKVASSRVDTAIRLADAEAAHTKTAPHRIEEQPENQEILVPEISEEIPDIGDMPMEDYQPAQTVALPEEIDEAEPEISEEIPDIDDIPMEVYQGEEEELAYQPEDVEYEELHPSAEEEAEQGYVSFENVNQEEDQAIEPEPEYMDDQNDYRESDTITEEIKKEEAGEEGYNMFPNDEELAAAKRKVNIRRIVQIIGAALVVVALIFVVKFVMLHWQTILIIAGILIVLAILIVWFKRKRS